jgi:hypothetical protein
MCEDLRKSNFSSDSELPTIIDQYEKTLEETLQKHAPLKRRTITLRPSAPWYNEEISKAKNTIEDTSVAGEHLDCALTKRYILNN